MTSEHSDRQADEEGPFHGYEKEEITTTDSSEDHIDIPPDIQEEDREEFLRILAVVRANNTARVAPSSYNYHVGEAGPSAPPPQQAPVAIQEGVPPHALPRLPVLESSTDDATPRRARTRSGILFPRTPRKRKRGPRGRR